MRLYNNNREFMCAWYYSQSYNHETLLYQFLVYPRLHDPHGPVFHSHNPAELVEVVLTLYLVENEECHIHVRQALVVMFQVHYEGVVYCTVVFHEPPEHLVGPFLLAFSVLDILKYTSPIVYDFRLLLIKHI